MSSRLHVLPAPPRVSRLLLDSSLLLVLAVGRIDPLRLGRDSRLKAYSAADYEILHQYTAVFPTRLTTPHILAEVSNHLDNIEPRLLPALRVVLSEWKPIRESWTPANILCAQAEYLALGLTDAAILQAARTNTVIVTADRALWGALAKRHMNTIHYSDIVRR